MVGEVHVVTESPRHLAVAREWIHPDASGQLQPVGVVMISLLDKVWDFLRAEGVRNRGINVAKYEPDGAGGLLIEAGVEVEDEFEERNGVRPVETPGGEAAVATVLGEYSEIGAAHEAVKTWCHDRGRQTTGIRWEVYGHHSDDPSRRRTDVYYALTRPGRRGANS